MSSRLPFLLLSACALGASVMAVACKDPLPVDATPADGGQATAVTLNEDCPADDTWLPAKGGPPPPVRLFNPRPHPDTECPFYRGAYQNFLIATTPLANGETSLVRYPTIDDAFVSAKPNHLVRNSGSPSADPYSNPTGAATVRKGPPTGKAWLGAVKQAGQRNVLVDRDHHTLYYGIHMNEAFVDFIKSNGLETEAGILKVDHNLQFTDGLVEIKTAWKDIDPRDFPDRTGHLGTPNGIVPPPGDGPIFDGDPGDYSNYITTMAWIPWLSQDAKGVVHEDSDHPVQRKMALIAFHSVYTLPGHPEFVWGSVQHVNVNVIDPAPVTYAGVAIPGAPDSQPDTTGPLDKNGVANPALPADNDPQNLSSTLPANSPHNYLLYEGNTPEYLADQAIPDKSLKLDEASQSFPGQSTSVYRMFPGSKANTLQPDSAIFSLNSNINVLFKNAIASHAIDPKVDKRQHYRLVAAVWMDKPALFGLGPDPTLGMTLQNDDTNPLVVAAMKGDPRADISQGTFCGTPLDSTNTSGNAPNADGTNNTVPGCQTRADLLAAKPPADPAGDFANHVVGTDSPFSLLGGEDRLSSTAMESFTQNGRFHNCFACHNTQPITTNGTPGDPNCNDPTCPQLLIPFAARINVSHLFSEFIGREHE